jgi:hypothetical protein
LIPTGPRNKSTAQAFVCPTGQPSLSPFPPLSHTPSPTLPATSRPPHPSPTRARARVCVCVCVCVRANAHYVQVAHIPNALNSLPSNAETTYNTNLLKLTWSYAQALKSKCRGTGVSAMPPGQAHQGGSPPHPESLFRCFSLLVAAVRRPLSLPPAAAFDSATGVLPSICRKFCPQPST